MGRRRSRSCEASPGITRPSTKPRVSSQFRTAFAMCLDHQVLPERVYRNWYNVCRHNVRAWAREVRGRIPDRRGRAPQRPMDLIRWQAATCSCVEGKQATINGVKKAEESIRFQSSHQQRNATRTFDGFERLPCEIQLNVMKFAALSKGQRDLKALVISSCAAHGLWKSSRRAVLHFRESSFPEHSDFQLYFDSTRTTTATKGAHTRGTTTRETRSSPADRLTDAARRLEGPKADDNPRTPLSDPYYYRAWKDLVRVSKYLVLGFPYLRLLEAFTAQVDRALARVQAMPDSNLLAPDEALLRRALLLLAVMGVPCSSESFTVEPEEREEFQEFLEYRDLQAEFAVHAKLRQQFIVQPRGPVGPTRWIGREMALLQIHHDDDDDDVLPALRHVLIFLTAFAKSKLNLFTDISLIMASLLEEGHFLDEMTQEEDAIAMGQMRAWMDDHVRLLVASMAVEKGVCGLARALEGPRSRLRMRDSIVASLWDGAEQLLNGGPFEPRVEDVEGQTEVWEFLELCSGTKTWEAFQERRA